MNTLQKISDIEAKLVTLETKMGLFERLTVEVPRLTQEITRVNQDLAKVTAAVQDVFGQMVKRTGDLGQVDNMVITRLMGLEQSYGSLAKTLGAIVSELSDSKVIDQQSVMTRLKKNDEKEEQERIDKMLQLKVITPSDEVLPDSLIVVSQSFTLTDGSVDNIADFRSIELSAPDNDEETKKNYIGKHAGDVVNLNLPDGTLTTTILKIYNYVQTFAQGGGEGPGTPADDQSNQASPQQEASNQ